MHWQVEEPALRSQREAQWHRERVQREARHKAEHVPWAAEWAQRQEQYREQSQAQFEAEEKQRQAQHSAECAELAWMFSDECRAEIAQRRVEEEQCRVEEEQCRVEVEQPASPKWESQPEVGTPTLHLESTKMISTPVINNIQPTETTSTPVINKIGNQLEMEPEGSAPNTTPGVANRDVELPISLSNNNSPCTDLPITDTVELNNFVSSELWLQVEPIPIAEQVKNNFPILETGPEQIEII